MMKRNFIALAAALTVLLFGATAIFAQCGADGMQPCKTSVKPKKIKSQPIKPKLSNKIKPAVSKIQSPLKSQLIGKWEGSPRCEECVLTYNSNNTGNISVNGKVCAILSFALTGNILVENHTPTGKCDDFAKFKILYRIEFNEEGNLLFFDQLEDGTFSEDPDAADLWTRIE